MRWARMRSCCLGVRVTMVFASTPAAVVEPAGEDIETTAVNKHHRAGRRMSSEPPMNGVQKGRCEMRLYKPHGRTAPSTRTYASFRCADALWYGNLRMPPRRRTSVFLIMAVHTAKRSTLYAAFSCQYAFSASGSRHCATPPQLYMICGKLRFESALNRQASLRRAVALNRLAV